MKNFLVLDLETQKSFSEVGRDNLHKLKISVVGVYDYADDTYRIYHESELMDLEKRMLSTELIIGFNIRRFDLPVLKPYFFTPIKKFPLLDLMEEIEKIRGHRVSLQSVAQATLGTGKSGRGLQAVELFNEGKMEELKKYCLDDVRITKEIYEYGAREGKIIFISNRDWKNHEVPVSWGEIQGVKREAEFPTSLF